jgi:putative flavoprotein involved in K+ transport
MERIETVIVGAGQAGLFTSYWLTKQGHEHVVLERAPYPAPVWRDNRWDSFTMVTPNWAFRTPDTGYTGPDPDGFMPRSDVLDLFARFVSDHQLPVRCNTSVLSVEATGDHSYRIRTQDGLIEAANVVIATGIFQFPKLPPFAQQLSPGIAQVHTHTYRNPQSLPEGAVLVVGSAMSGCQIAEELHRSSRTVYLSTGGAGRAPRRYRGKDIIEWLDTIGFFDLSIEQMPPGSTRWDAIPHVSGADGGHTINLHEFARDGVTLLGRMRDAEGTIVRFAPNLYENLARADGFAGMMTQMIDGYILGHGLDIPVETLPQPQDGFSQPIIEKLDLAAAGISTVVWATGYWFDFGMVKLPVLDHEGFPITDRGVTDQAGLYFVGQGWMPSHRTEFLIGVADSARHIASHIVSAAVPA